MTDRESMVDAVHDLVHSWTDVVTIGRTYQAVDHDPLLVTLRQTIRSNPGGSTAGASDDATRNVLNLEAFTIWEHITIDVRTLTRNHTRDNPNPLLGLAIQRLAERLDAAHHTNQIPEHEYLSAVRKANGWRTRIWALLHKPREVEITAPCPIDECSARWVQTADGDIQSALVAYYQHGGEETARCRACGTAWDGRHALIRLGEMIDAPIDRDTVNELTGETTMTTNHPNGSRDA